jgi:hypothetical protein
MMAKRIKPGDLIAADTFFYTIPLEQNTQRLTRAILEKHFPSPKSRKAYMGNRVEYKSYKNGIVTAEVSLNDQSQNMLYLHVGLEELHIACACGMPEEKLCYHAYMGLYSMTWRGYLDLGMYYWPGYESDDKIKDKFLHIEISKDRIFVEPKLRYGNIFKPDIGFEDNKHLLLHEPIARPETIKTSNRQVIAYCLGYSFAGYYSSQLPVLMTCLGLTGKDDKKVVSFRHFIRKDKPANNIDYTSNQQLLNEISARQCALAQSYDELPRNERELEISKIKRAMLDLWQQALPLLVNEKYTYWYYTYWLRYQRAKPRKADMHICNYATDPPVLSFLLKFHQDHFSFIAVVSVNRKALKFEYKPHFFVFDENTDLCYLMASVQDDDLLMWVLSNNKRLTILKEHFAEFHQKFLDRLSSCYTVLFMDHKSKKTVPYNFEVISSQLS